MPKVKSADIPSTLTTTERLREGTRIPKKLISIIPMIADKHDISNPLPGIDDQKCFLSRTIKTLN
jgi:hypothetical protein